ncbi:MAG: TIGR03564 family F420-dependent LLM class oxidoreductase [Pseudomonadales bacterium]
MKIGINGSGMVQKASVEAIADHAATAAKQGFAHYWLAEHPTGGLDALTTLALVGQRVPDIELGTAIVPTFPRHPMALAGQALTVADAIGERLTVGIGLSHEPMMAQLGIGFEKPIRHLREYLSILMPLLHEGATNFDGELLSCDAKLFQTPKHNVPVLVAALGPQALAVTGQWADGTTLAWVGPKTIREHIVPRLQEAAAEHQRPVPRVVATLPICVTEQSTTVRESIGKGLSLYGRLPSYQAMFEREGASGPADVAVVGSRTEVMDQVAALAEAGVTDFAPSEFCLNRDEWSATRELLVELAANFGK